MKIKITLIAAVILVTASAALYYANKVFFPVKFKKIVIEQAEKALHRKVSIGSIHFHPLSGFAVDELTIFEKNSDEIPFVQLKKITFSILFLSIFKEKKIAIPSLTVDEPYLSISRQENKIFNFNDLLPQDEAAGQSKGSLSVVIGKLTVSDGKIKYFDQTTAPNFSETIENIQIKANISFLKNVNFFLEAQIPEENASAFISAKGEYQLASQALNATVDLRDAALMEYLPYYYNQPFVQFKNGLIKEAHFIISSQGKKMVIKSEITADNLNAQINGTTGYIGSPKAILDFQYDAGAVRPLEYSGSLEPNQSTLTGLPHIEKAENISGKIYFKTDKITSDALTFSTLDTEIKLSGQLLDFKDPALDIQVSTDIKLELLKNIIPDLVKKANVDAKGQAQISVSFQGKIKAPEQADIKIKAQLKDVSVNSEKFPGPLTGINGEVNYMKDKMSWRNLTITFFERAYTLDGELQNFSRPNLGATIHSEGLSVKTQAIAILGGIKINILKGQFLDSVFDLSGKVRLPKGGQPSFIAAGKLDLQLDNLSKITPPLTEKLKEFNPSGMINLVGSVAGPTADWQSWQFNLEAKSPTMSISNLQLRDIALTYGQNLKIKSLKGQYLDSSFDVTGEIQLPKNASMALGLTGTINLELSNLLKINPDIENKLKNLNPAGRLNIAGSVNGPVKDWMNLNINAKAQGPLVSLSGYKLNDISVVYNQNNRVLQQFDVAAAIYDGEFQIKSSAKFTEGLPFILTAALENTNLAKLKKDTAFKDKDVSGYFSSAVEMQGNIQDLDTITGQGSVAIKDGNIWQLNLLQGLGVLLFIPEFSRISFVGAQGNFITQNQKVSTENFQMDSEEVTVLGKGWVDFSGKLDFDITAHFSDKTIEESSSIKRALTTILSQTNDFMTIKLSGTLKEPKYSVVPLPIDLLKQTGELLKDGLQGIFQ